MPQRVSIKKIETLCNVRMVYFLVTHFMGYCDV